MRRLPILMLILPVLAACGEADKAAPQAKEAPKAAAAPVAPVAAAPADLEAACRQEVETLFGQSSGEVSYRPAGDGKGQVSWPAPVDGGVLSFECRTDGDRVGLFRDGRKMSVDVQMAAPAAEQEAR
ncbi:hypothetical protein [Brevundimonas sp. SORGH_AS_0993]|uniref:hypothetical protein n=1 Tax=Brevundimonas sp. SORGH_AS_0993 TaxID=3041794 RepID=UPI00277E605C|nr:hypothetical protein [Brevundimonas sp. SORGH_AS_0993]MDQ1153298.1 hypothetical protein [Brevundimonas sp. SORGH_AS_0993]